LRKAQDHERFCQGIQHGDVVILRLGTSTICGVGIAGDYEWRDEFGDIDGWDLQHVRRVQWLWRRDKDEGGPTLKAWDLKQGDTTQSLRGDGLVRDWLTALQVPQQRYSQALPDLSQLANETKISIEAVSDYLFDQGVASTSVSSLVDQIDDLTRIAKWYKRTDQKPSEHETVAYLVVPLLRTLGWTPQRMAVEWQRVDVALFESLPRTDATLRVVVEAKKMSDSCLTAFSQAADYAIGKAVCHRLIVTDGLRYGVYVRRGTEPFRLYAYLNLERLRSAYPVYSCLGAREALLAMAPEWRLN
jgi:hypothetical protein